MIDLTTLKAGDTVSFRCGGEAVVTTNVSEDCGFKFCISTETWGDRYRMDYFKTGEYAGGAHHPFDITEVIPKPFDWADVKQGMAFINDAGYVFIFEVIDHRGYHVFETASDRKNAYIGLMVEMHGEEELTRCPEHDIAPTTNGGDND